MILEQVKDYVSNLFLEYGINPENGYYYHNLDHTLTVFNEATKLAKKYKLSPEDTEILQLAALFHDVGFIKQYDNNEPIGAEIAEEWLLKQGYSKDKIEKIKKLILVTQYTQKPTNLLEFLMKMADFANIFDDKIVSCGNKLRKELEIIKGLKFSDKDWLADQQKLIQFLIDINQDFSEENVEILQKVLKPIEGQLSILTV